MTTSDIIEAIDSEIEKLRQARTLLIEAADSEASVRRRGRPKGSTRLEKVSDGPAMAKKAKRSMSAAGKARISAAQKARWAAQKKAEKSANKSVAAVARKAVKAPAKKAAKKTAKTLPARNSVAVETQILANPAGSDAVAT